MEVLVVRQQGVGLGTVEVAVPDTEQSKDHRHLKFRSNWKELRSY